MHVCIRLCSLYIHTSLLPAYSHCAVGPDEKLPLTEAESAEQLVVTGNTYMYGDGKLAESGLDSEIEAADPSACSHRIIHVAPFCKYPDGKDGTLVQNQGFEQPEKLVTHLSSDSLTDKISLLVDTSEGGDPQVDNHTHDQLADAHTDEVCPSPPSPTSADSPLLPPLTHAGTYVSIYTSACIVGCTVSQIQYVRILWNVQRFTYNMYVYCPVSVSAMNVPTHQAGPFMGYKRW